MKKFTLYILLSVLSGVLILSNGCFFFKKNLMKDDADDVEEMVIVNSNGEDYLISKEEIFQTTSKSSKGGIRTTTGYTEYRLTSYNLKTGIIEKKIELGERDDDYLNFLGVADNKLWYVSINDEIGLHSRDPKTLEIVNSLNEITDANPNLKNNFPKVKWYELSKYYGFNMTTKMPMFSDNSGYVYELDTKTLKANIVNESIKKFDFKKSTESTSIHFNSEKYLTLTGEPRKYLQIGSKSFKELSFLNGEFLLTSNSTNLAEMFPPYVQPIMSSINQNQNKIDSLKIIFENNKDQIENNKDYRIRYLERDIQRLEDDNKRKYEELDRINKETYTSLITPDSGVYIQHRTSASDTAKVLISKIIIDPDKPDAKIIWTTLLENVFCEPGKVYEKDGFEYVFSKGNPKLDTRRILYKDNYLIYMTMLKCVCLNIKTGEVLWKNTM